MKHRLSLLLSFTFLLQALTLLLDAPDMFACTAFLVKNGKHVLFGNNEDYLNPATIMWFMPKGVDAYGRVYFGFDDLNPQGGMNEAGLVMDGFATAQIPVKKRLNGITLSIPSLMNKAMATCATVQEVIDLFNRYNMKELESFMLMFGDRSGDAVIFEGDEIVRKSGPFQLVTNFHLSSDLKGENPAGPEKTWGADMRFKIATGMLQDTRDFTVKRARDILAAVYADGPQYMTLYSNVYDLNTRRIYLYHFHDFQNAVVVDLARELAKGRHFVNLSSLFPRTYAFESYLRAKTEERQQRNVKRKTVQLDSQQLSRYAGEYESESILGRLTISVEQNKLYGEITGMGHFELIPSSETEFFNTRIVYDIDLAFRVDAASHIVEARFKSGEQDVAFMRKQ